MNTVSLRKFLFVFVADEAFALKPFMLRLFPRRNDLNFHKLIFNYRLSRARQVVKKNLGDISQSISNFQKIYYWQNWKYKKHN